MVGVLCTPVFGGLAAVAWQQSYARSSALRIPVFGVAFGAWLGGLLGLMRINPEYQAWQDQLELGARLVAVAVPPECERMLRRQMTDCGWQYLSQTLRYAGSYRFPQNRLEVGAI